METGKRFFFREAWLYDKMKKTVRDFRRNDHEERRSAKKSRSPGFPDDAGRKATQRFKKNVKGKIIKEIIYEEDGKDINDLQENFLNLPINFV